MPDKRRKSRKQRRNRRRQRGGDASTWAGAVYGQAGSQTAIPGTNLIAAQNLSGVNMCSGGAVGIAANAAPVMGGSATVVAHAPAPAAAPTKGGRGILTDVAVPAVLLYANNAMKGRKSYGKKHRKSRRSRKFRRY